MSENLTVTCLQMSYGRPQLSVEAVESFLRQTYPHKLLYIFNVHPSPIIFSQAYDNIKVFNRSGFSHLSDLARYAISQVQSPLYCFWHDDDVFLPWHLEQRVNVYHCLGKPEAAIGHEHCFVSVNNEITGLEQNLFFSQHLFVNNGRLPEPNRSCWDLDFYNQWDPVLIPYSTAHLPSYIYRLDHGERHIGSGSNEQEQHAVYQTNLSEKRFISYPAPWLPDWRKDYEQEVRDFLRTNDLDSKVGKEKATAGWGVNPIQATFPDLPDPFALLHTATPVFDPKLYQDYQTLLHENVESAELAYAALGITQRQTPEPLVSVVLVARNEDEWLRKCVESLNQAKSYTNFEIVVIDDQSSDGCVSELQLDQGFVTNGIGPSRARNLGADKARGEILIFCDAHLKFPDLWLDQLIQPILDGRADVVNPVISDIAVPTTLGFGWDFDSNTYEYKWSGSTNQFRFQSGVAGGCLAIRKRVFDQVGQFDSGFIRWGMEDSELSLRLVLSGYRLALEPAVVVGHFFKENNDYGVDWLSYNYNFLRMAYINMDREGVKTVFSKVPGSMEDKIALFDLVVKTSGERKQFVELNRRMPFSDFLIQFSRPM